MRNIIERIRGYAVEESPGEVEFAAQEANDAIGPRSWGSPRATTKMSMLHDLEPVARFRRSGLTIFFGERLGDLVTSSMSREEIDEICLALARRVTRELHDSAQELNLSKRQYAAARAERLKK